MKGMSAATGAPLTGSQHIVQSIHDILTTPIGSRVMLREYGSRIPSLVDEPMNELLDVELHSATAEALERWEPRFKLTAVWIAGKTATGRLTLGLEGQVISDGSVISLEGISF